MIGTSQLINAFGPPVCFTDTTDIFKDRSGVALYGLDYDASDAGGASGKFGEAAIFNGSSSKIDINSLATVLDAQNIVSVSFWFKSSATALSGLFSYRGSASSAVNMTVSLNRSATGDIGLDSSTSGAFVTLGTYNGTYNDGNWHHVVSTINYSTGAFNVYIDQTLRITGTNASISRGTADKVQLGTNYGSQFLNGNIDQVRIFNTALTQSQVTQLYQENNSTVGTHLFGCIANYNLDGNAKESMGTTAYDGTETDITYRYDGTPTAVDFGVGGKTLYGARFNGSSSYIDLGTSLLGSKSTFSVSAWVNFDNLNTQNFIFYNSESGTGGNVGFYDFGNGSIYFQPDASTSANRGYISNSGIYTTDEWVHIIMVFDGSATGNSNRLKAYIQGTERTLTYDGTIPSSTGTSTASSWIGGRASTKFSGDIDQVRVFNKALSSAEVGKLYGNGAGEIACEYTATTTDIAYPIANTAYYKLDNNSKDSARSTGKFNEGAIFNGSSSYINLNHNTTYSDLTISAWVNVTSTSSRQFIVGKWYDGSNRSIAFMMESGGVLKLITSSTGADTVTTTGGTLTANTWHFVCFTFQNGGDVTITLDGSTTTTTQNTSINNNNQNWLIGMEDYRNINHWNGSIDQVRIYNTALSSTDVSNLYAETVSDTSTLSFPSGKTAIATYQLDGNSTDLSGNYNGTDTNITYAYDGTESNIEYRFGRYGQAAVFNGSSSYITSNSLPSIGTGDFTFSCWFNQNSGSSQGALFSTTTQWFAANGSVSPKVLMVTDDTVTKKGDTAYSQDTWNHAVFARESGVLKIYQNGTEVFSGAYTDSWDMTQFGIGVARAFGSRVYYFNGKIDQVRIFSSALTSTQVESLYNEYQDIDTVTAPTGNLRFDEFWAGYDDGQTNRAEFKLSGKGVDFNAYSEGHAVLNQNPQTSGKYYLEIKLVGTSGHDGFGVFNRSTNTVYDVSPYAAKNPVDGNYGATLYARGSLVYAGNVSQSGFTNLSLTDGDIVCIAVNVDEKRIWWGRRDGLSDSSITWNSGNPNGGYGGLEVSFVPSDVIVAHVSETSSRFSEFEVLDHADMLEPPFNFSYLDGAFTTSLTENEANF